MSTREEKNNSKEKYIKLKSPLYLSPHPLKKQINFTKLYTEENNIYKQTDYNLSKNNIKPKINSKKK